ncbi:uncharacterized protein LOC110274852 [Arachis duranensis]|uniref:Uncharacterized protein LOC110274852 n=1 Tax=Arachis duranensis TaxID=130453 RepID=A0A6P5MMU4_ARADU|nr:uncharacterized protein LOC110274852 [Arachis duranensis]
MENIQKMEKANASIARRERRAIIEEKRKKARISNEVHTGSQKECRNPLQTINLNSDTSSSGKENNIYWKNGDTSIQTSIRLEGTVNNEPNLGFPVERNLASKTPDSRDDAKNARRERALKLAGKRQTIHKKSAGGRRDSSIIELDLSSITSTQEVSQSTNPDIGKMNNMEVNSFRCSNEFSVEQRKFIRGPTTSPPAVGSNTRTLQAGKGPEYLSIGDPMHQCEYCNALFWYDERTNKHYKATEPKYTNCCKGGQVQIPHLQDAPKELYNLLYEDSPKSKHFRDNIRAYNNMFQFTSMGAKIDRSINRSKGPATFILCGENYHLMGSLIPPEGNVAKFAQLYVYDTQNEIQNRMNIFSRAENQLIHEDIVKDLKKMLDEHNVLVKAFRMVRESMRVDSRNSVKLRLLGKRGKDGRRYNLPSTNEIAALIVGDFDIDKNDRDIVIETQTGKLQRINQLNPAYLGLQYPLLFPYGEDGFKEDISLSKPTSNDGKGRQHMSMREFFAFRIQERLADGSPLLYSRRLFQQFLVDAYSMIESSRLNYIRHNQDKFRCEMYKQIKDAVLNGETTPSCKGKRIILPSSFTGGPRYMIQNYQDAMAICKVVGYPDLFITFTCNPKWPELEDFFDNRELRAEDRPDMVCRAFKVKLDCLIKDIKANRIFGRVSADDKYPTGEEIDQIISAEIPDREKDPVYFDAVEKHMMHGPCGNFRKQSPCMENGKCIRHFPKIFVDETTVDEDGYPLYRRRDDGRIINKSGVDLDNCYVVPHNRFLLLRYGAHINVEWCNQSRSIKYLFKYVNKGNDRVTTAFYKSVGEDVESDEIDEISMYYDCRYISPCEAVWRIFGYSIHYRDPSVVRLGFHLPDEQNVIFKDHDNLDEVAREASVKESMFLGWFEANKEYREARSLTFAELPTKFVWKAQERIWVPRKSHAVIGRIFFVPPGSGEIYYLRLLLNLVKGPTCYEDIRTVDGTVYSTFRDACYARGLLDDDREYIDAIQEANNWGSGEYLRKLFATLLFSNSMTRPEYVWDNTWHILSDDILHRQKRILDNPGILKLIYP